MLAVGLLISLAVHAFVLTRGIAVGEGGGRPGDRPSGPEPSQEAMLIVSLETTPAAVTEPDVEVDAPVLEPAPAPPLPQTRKPGTSPSPDRKAPTARFAPGFRDARLWGDPRSPPAGHTDPAAEERLRLDARVDSARDAEAGAHVPAAGDLSVLTKRDGNGDRWGLAPGALHLGSLTLPTCGGTFDASNCGFGIAPSRRGEYRRRLDLLNGLQRQAARGDLQERARAIRTRTNSVAARDSIPHP